MVGGAIKRHARIEHKTQRRKQRRVVCKVTTLPKLGFRQRALSDLLKAPVRELSFGHVSVEGFNVNLSESLGLTRWDPRACAPVRELSIGQLHGNKQPATGGRKCFVLAAEDTQGRDIPEKHQPHL